MKKKTKNNHKHINTAFAKKRVGQPQNLQEYQQNINPQQQVNQSQQSQDLQLRNENSRDGEGQYHKQPNDIQQKFEQDYDNEQLDADQKDLQNYQEQLSNKGVIYMSRIPPYMTPNFVKKLLSAYSVERIYFLPESQWARNNRIKRGGSNRICFREGWIEFTDKRLAKMAALTLNGRKMVQKKGNFYSEDLWNLKYLPKFKWHHLTEKLAHEERLKKERLRMELDQQKKLQQYYSSQASKSKTISGIVKKKLAKGKIIKKDKKNFGQRVAIEQQAG